MTHAEFDNFQDTLLDEVVKMKNTKGTEYANGEDRFGNFRRLSSSLGLTPEQIGWVYLAKHLDSLQSYIRTGQTFSNESIRSRFVDAITYLTLIAGMVEERLQESSNGGYKDKEPGERHRRPMPKPYNPGEKMTDAPTF